MVQINKMYLCLFLRSQFIYVLDSGYSGIYVWTGKDSEVDFRKRVWEAVNVRPYRLFHDKKTLSGSKRLFIQTPESFLHRLTHSFVVLINYL